MARNNHPNQKTHGPNRDRDICTLHCAYDVDLMSTPLYIERAFKRGAQYVIVNFEYLDHSDLGFDEDEWSAHVLDFYQFEGLVNFLIHEFDAREIKDERPLQYKSCYHSVRVVFVEREDYR